MRTYTTVIGGRMENPVEADSLELAVAKATTAAIMELGAMAAAFGVEFGQATEGFAMGLVDGDISIEIVEVTGK